MFEHRVHRQQALNQHLPWRFQPEPPLRCEQRGLHEPRRLLILPWMCVPSAPERFALRCDRRMTRSGQAKFESRHNVWAALGRQVAVALKEAVAAARSAEADPVPDSRRVRGEVEPGPDRPKVE